jgi:hypothetical protein
MLKVFVGALFAALLVPVFALASEGAIEPPTGDELLALLNALGGLKGLGGLAIAAVAVQGAMLLLRTSAGELLGKYRLLAVYGLSIVSGVIALKIAGVELGAALVHANTLAAFQVFLNQVFKQFFQKTA